MRVGNVELDAGRTCVCKRSRRDATVNGCMVRRGWLRVVGVVLLGDRSSDRHKRRRRSAGSGPRQFRKMGECGHALTYMTMDFVRAR